MKLIQKRPIGLLCMIVSFALLLTSLPMVAFAAAIDEAESIADMTEPIDAVTDNGTAETDAYIVEELEERREPNIKHFRMSDGTYTAAVYPYDVHHEDNTGKLVDIDNSIHVDVDEEDDDVFQNESSSTYVKFMKKSNKNKLYTIVKGNRRIKVGIDGASKVNAETGSSDDGEVPLSDDRFVLNDIESRITYPNIFDNTDIEFTLVSTALKENIILKQKVDLNSLTYTYHVNGSITAVQNDRQSISLLDGDGELVLRISAPVMWDANGNYSDDLKLEIVKAQNTKNNGQTKLERSR